VLRVEGRGIGFSLEIRAEGLGRQITCADSGGCSAGVHPFLGLSLCGLNSIQFISTGQWFRV
jgi:hypothetical protein